MQLAILADVHGNLPALEAVLADAGEYGVDDILVAGDMVHRGPYPHECLALLRSSGATMIRGNSDSRLVAFYEGSVPESWRSSRQRAPLRWTYKQLTEEDCQFLADLPLILGVEYEGSDPLLLLHGSLTSETEILDPWRDRELLEDTMLNVMEDVIISAHSHRSWTFRANGKLALNPGAVSFGRKRPAKATYAILTWNGYCWDVEHRTIPYDPQMLVEAAYDRGLLAEGGILARASLYDVITGGAYFETFIAHVRDLANQSGATDCENIPDDIWQEAEETFSQINPIWDTLAAGANLEL